MEQKLTIHNCQYDESSPKAWVKIVFPLLSRHMDHLMFSKYAHPVVKYAEWDQS